MLYSLYIFTNNFINFPGRIKFSPKFLTLRYMLLKHILCIYIMYIYYVLLLQKYIHTNFYLISVYKSLALFLSIPFPNSGNVLIQLYHISSKVVNWYLHLHNFFVNVYSRNIPNKVKLVRVYSVCNENNFNIYYSTPFWVCFLKSLSKDGMLCAKTKKKTHPVCNTSFHFH